jgi:hypothetical protein
MKQHGERMARIDRLLEQMDEQHDEMLRIADRITKLREKIRREVAQAPRRRVTAAKGSGPE